MNSNDISKITANIVESTKQAAKAFNEMSERIKVAVRSPRILRMDLVGGYTHPIPSFTLRPNDILTKRLKRVQVRFPKSKRKRIRKKWSKRDCNYEYKDHYIEFRMGDVILVHSSIYNKFLKDCENIEKSGFDTFLNDSKKVMSEVPDFPPMLPRMGN